MSDNQMDYISSVLELMAKKNFLPDNMNPDDKKDLETQLGFRAGQLMTQYEADRDEASKLAKDDKRRKEIEKNVENLAKALPNITKGTLAAITAFQKNDPISGSAAIMDICSSVAPIIGGLAAAGGPPGMLVGAIFAMIGQILSFFAPKSESLTSQIEKMLRTLEAERAQQKIIKVHQNIRMYASTLRQASNLIGQELDKPVLTLMVTNNLVKMLNPLEGDTVDSFKDVMNWLAEKNNQSQELWPLILESACQSWSNMLMASIQLASLVHTDKLTSHYNEAEKMTGDKKADTEKALLKLQANVIAHLLALTAENDLVVELLKQLLPDAQNRGRVWIIDDTNKGHLYSFTDIRKAETTYLGGELKRLATTVAAKDLSNPTPEYHVFSLEPWVDQGYSGYDRTYHGISGSPYKNIDWKELNCDAASLHALTDIWAIPGKDQNEISFFSAKENDIYEYVLDKQRNAKFIQKYPLKSKAISVRVISKPESIQDVREEKNQNLVLEKIEQIIYAGCASSSEIYVRSDKKEGYVSCPWGSYKGLTSDQQYVWIYTAEGIACASHESVIRCLNGEIQKPTWIEHFPNDLLYTSAYHEHKNQISEHPLLQGVIDVSACDDKTLVASIFSRTATSFSYDARSAYSYYKFVDHNALYTATYSIDPKASTIAINWKKMEGTTGVRLQKSPIFCWDTVVGLVSMLEKVNPMLKKSTGNLPN